MLKKFSEGGKIGIQETKTFEEEIQGLPDSKRPTVQETITQVVTTQERATRHL